MPAEGAGEKVGEGETEELVLGEKRVSGSNWSESSRVGPSAKERL